MRSPLVVARSNRKSGGHWPFAWLRAFGAQIAPLERFDPTGRFSLLNTLYARTLLHVPEFDKAGSGVRHVPFLVASRRVAWQKSANLDFSRA